MTRAEMDTNLERLVMLRGMPGDTDEYFSALSDIPLPVFSAACDHALKTRTWFPVPAELRLDCDVVRHAVRRNDPEPEPQYRELEKPVVFTWTSPFDPAAKLRIPITRTWNHDCNDCSDTGWSSRFCGPADDAKDWQKVGHCGRRGDHGSHEFVEKCHCLDWNPTIRRRKDAATRYAAEKSH